MKISNSLIGALIISVALLASNACAEELDRIELPGAAVFPESISADAAGNLYGGSPASGGIWRIKPGDARSEQWIAPGAFGSHSTFGVLVDEKAKLLWVCSNDVSFLDIAGPGSATGSHLKGFDLASGEGKLSVMNYPSEMTHASVKGTELAVPVNLIRLSCGIEDVEDLIADLEQALAGLKSGS